MKNIFYVQLMFGNPFNCGTKNLESFEGTRTPHRPTAVKVIQAPPAHTQEIVIFRKNWNNVKGIFNVCLDKGTSRANSLNEPDGIFDSCIGDTSMFWGNSIIQGWALGKRKVVNWTKRPQFSWVPNQVGKLEKKGGGDEKGPASLRNSSSLQSLASAASGVCRAAFRFGESHDKREPSQCIGKPSLNPFTSKSTIEGVFPERKKRRRLLSTGIGNSRSEGRGRAGFNGWLDPRDWLMTCLLRARKLHLRALWDPSHLKHACLKTHPEQSPPLWNLKQYTIGTRSGEMGFLEAPAGGVSEYWGYSGNGARAPSECFPNGGMWVAFS